MVESFIKLLRNKLPRPLLEALIYMKHYGEILPGAELYLSYITQKKGIEIGGPSTLFKTVLPIYQKISRLDGVNFSSKTIWEGEIRPGMTFNYLGNKTGLQYISDATTLSDIPSGNYDFVLSSNCLEHIANPLKALIEWNRLIKAGGVLILVVPNKAYNFDHRRPFTNFEHIVEDYKSGITEFDLTHLEEILTLHDLGLDPAAGSHGNFTERSMDNHKNRTLHHHVFCPDVITKMLNYSGFSVADVSIYKKDFFALGVK